MAKKNQFSSQVRVKTKFNANCMISRLRNRHFSFLHLNADVSVTFTRAQTWRLITVRSLDMYGIYSIYLQWATYNFWMLNQFCFILTAQTIQSPAVNAVNNSRPNCSLNPHFLTSS